MKVDQLRSELIEIFAELRSGKISRADAQEMNNTAGKILLSAKAELSHRFLTEDKTPIPFLDTSPKTKELGENKPLELDQSA